MLRKALPSKSELILLPLEMGKPKDLHKTTQHLTSLTNHLARG